MSEQLQFYYSSYYTHTHIQTNKPPPISHKAKGYWQDWREYTLSQIHTTLTRHWYVHRHNSRTVVMWLSEVQRMTFICFKWRLDLRQTDHEQDLVWLFLRWSPRWHEVDVETSTGEEEVRGCEYSWCIMGGRVPRITAC